MLREFLRTTTEPRANIKEFAAWYQTYQRCLRRGGLKNSLALHHDTNSRQKTARKIF